MREIQLTKGYVAMIDDDDYERISMHRWHALVARDGRVEILAAPPDMLVDHRDHNALNNQRLNLRLATSTQNIANSRKCRRVCRSRFKGVRPERGNARWTAYIAVGGKWIYLGAHASEEAAARAYDAAAIRQWGEFAHINFPPPQGVLVVGALGAQESTS